MNKNHFSAKHYCFFLLFYTNLSYVPNIAANTDQACTECHADYVKQWQTSHHYHAMAPASQADILGDFTQKTLHEKDTAIRFFRKDGKATIAMPNLSGKTVEYPVAHAFGYFPLQQYTFETAPGKFQFFPYAWDSRTKTEGGQRWFNLYPGMRSNEEFHWSQMGQNWNQMCVECHVTDYKKNFNSDTQTYSPAYSAGNVSCDACHGNSSAHLKWAAGDTQISNKGYDVYIGAQTPLFVPDDKGVLKAISTLKPSQQINSCASCHSRRSAFKDRGKPHEFYDQYQPALLTADLYHLDGQIWDEDYVWGSFLQSKKYQAGVSCSNCHNPHTGQIKITGNGLCTQCHGSEPYDTQQHHGHQAASSGSACVDCHMPATVYMAVDARRDHSFQIPRPDLTESIGVPNACNRCHDDKTAQWASAAIAKWHPQPKYQGQPHFAEIFYQADRGLPGADQGLTQISQNTQQPAIVRATALQRLGKTPGRNAIVAIQRAVQSEEPLLHQAAIRTAAPYELQDRWRLLQPLLASPYLPIRVEAARSLAPLVNSPNLDEPNKNALQKILQEYREVQNYQADRGYAHTNLGNLASDLGQLQSATNHYRNAINIEPIFMPAYANLAELQRHQGNEQGARETLQQALKVNPAANTINYALAMSLVRAGQKTQALSLLKTAATEGEPNPNTIYAYALLLQDQNKHREAKAQLLKVYQLTPGNPDVSYSLSQAFLAEKNYERALSFARNLAKLIPGNTEIEAMVQRIEAMLEAGTQ